MKKYSVFIIAGTGLLAFIIALAVTLGPKIGKTMPQDTNSLVFTLAASWQGTNGEVINSVCLDGSNLFAAAGYEGLIVFDLPSLQPATDFVTNYPIKDVVVRHFQGRRILIAALGGNDGMGGIADIDCTELSNITIKNLMVSSNQNPDMLLVVTNRLTTTLYVGDEKSGLESFAVNWEKNEFIQGKPISFNTNIVLDVAIQADRAYIAAKELGVFVVDIPNRRIVDTLTSSISMANAVFVSSKKLIVADKMNGIMVYGLENPSHPDFIGNYSTPGDVYDVCMDENDLYLADGVNGVEKLKYLAKDKELFMLEKQFNDGSIAYKLFYSKKDGLLYVACGKDGIRVLR